MWYFSWILGIGVALDDFGTGFSSLSFNLPLPTPT